MYVNPANRIDRAASLAFACDAGRPVASPLPSCLVAHDQATEKPLFHVARVNPLGELAARGGMRPTSRRT